MADDNMTGSMAQQALTGVNGGASVPTPEPKVSEPKATGGFADLLGGFGVQQTQNAAAPTSGPLGYLAGGAPSAGGTALPQTPEALMSSLTAEAMKSAKEAVARRMATGRPASLPSETTQPTVTGGLAQATDVSQPSAQIPLPQAPTITMARPFGGGAAIPHYDYNGVSVALPDGVDANDSAAVGKAMAEQNEMIDIFNSMNDEEV